MSLRVTQGMMQTQLLTSLFQNEKKISDEQLQLSTGHKINKPSDDPVGITYALRYRSELSINAQQQSNANAAQSSLEHVDTVLGEVDNIVQRTKELTVQGVSGTSTPDSMNAISQELSQLYNSTVNIGNDTISGKFTFNGQQTDVQPYTSASADTQSTDTGKIKLQVGNRVQISTNITGNEVFGSGTDADNLFKIMKGLKTAFASGNQTAASAYMSQLDTRYNKIIQARADVGARTNRVTLMQSRLSDLNLNLTSLDSKTEDADYSKLITKFQGDQNVYQASLSAGAKIIQPSLIDYLK